LNSSHVGSVIRAFTAASRGFQVCTRTTESIVTEGNSWDELRANVREAVRGYYFDQPEKLAVRIRLRLVRDEVVAE
jgi:hypothetical protein